MNIALLIGAVVVAGGLVWCFRSRPAFEISVQEGKAHVASGRPPVEFVRDLEQLCADRGIASANIRGLSRGGGVRLEFSPETPGELHQRIRNLWGLHGQRASRM